MTKLLVKHIAIGIVVIFGALTLTFVLARMSGDPTGLILPQDASAEQRAQLRSQLGIDRPLLEQYLAYLGGAVRGDLGDSYFDSSSVSAVVLRYLPNTAILAVSSFVLTVLVAVPLGTLAAVRRGGVLDRLVQAVAVVGNSVPAFWSGLLLLQVFAVNLGWLPTFGTVGVASLILPTVNLMLFLFPQMARLTRASVLDVLPMPYVDTARTKGAGEFRVLTVHVLRNGLLPVLALGGVQFGSLFGGAVLTETVFAWPGIGTLAVRSISRSDFPVVQGIVVYVAVIFAIVTVLTEVLARAANPRLRTAA
ncbi:ABC transporter permease [Saccharopolyspora oryzae]|uniref:ABC transporter permease n=1 Tax=Saccharopolyspora oryzae TaxID=2997343 RepID=A0ABT4UXA2_9PSEU|nr:ABC transporter permease [Saccharopolyspora oryzae]MDA3626346.1 ABC transporter permease [Saccharopolyspora oryzae]